MMNKEDDQFYRNLPRKELQVLCKEYNLPANRSASDMAESLIIYSKKRNGSISSEGRLCGTHDTLFPNSLTSQLYPRMAPSFVENAGKDSYGLIFCPRAKSSCNKLCYCGNHKSNNKESFGVSATNCSKLSHPHCDGSTFDNKKSAATHFGSNYSGFLADAGRLPSSQYRDISAARCCPKECVRPHSLITSKKVHSPFEFHVASEKGLTLCVDLNSSPSDWIKEFRNEYDICENMCHNKSQHFQQEPERFGESTKHTKSSFTRSTDSAKDKDGLEEVVRSPSSSREEQCFTGFDHSNDGNGSATSFSIKLSGVDADVSEHLEEGQGLASLNAISVAQEQIMSGESGMKDGYTINLDSEAIKSGGDSVAIMSDGSTSIVTLEHQVSKVDNATWNNSTTLNNFNPGDTDMVTAGGLGGCSMKMASSEVEFHCENDNFLDLVDSVPNMETDNTDLATTSRKLPDISGNQSSAGLEEQETKKNINGGEDSDCVYSSFRCSEFDDLSEGSCLILDKLEPKEEVRRKRASMDSDNSTEYCRPDPKILRSTGSLTGKVTPRRSTRLVSK